MADTDNGVPAISFTPKTAPNVLFLLIFLILLLLEIYLLVRHRRGFGRATGMLGGLLLEMLGYVAKLKLAKNQYDKSGYIMYIIGLTLGPTFLSSALYLGLGRLQAWWSFKFFGVLGPRTIATLFILGDFLCLCFIGTGGSLAAIFAPQPIGIDLMVAGLAVQVLFTAIFCIFLLVIFRNIRKQLHGDVRRWFMLGEAIAAACLFIRSCWRVAELSGGFNGPLTSKEGIFIALDSVPMVAMGSILLALHPSLWTYRASGLGTVDSDEHVSLAGYQMPDRVKGHRIVSQRILV